MQIRSTIFATALLLAACTAQQEEAAPAEQAPPQESVDQVTAAMEAVYVGFADAFLTGEVAEMVQASYTPDAKLHPPESGPVEGHEAITAAIAGMVEAGIKITAAPDYVEVFGDAAFEYGIGELTMPDGAVAHLAYVVLWKKHDGTWKMHRDFISGTIPS